ncbi:hypothetical protein [Streptomyces sp. NBC_01431]|uniref:hypothetical protein n=1 Tax=Streptomyces sp. NBC_01431 TaxID=2903863 RepID=UPI002E2F1E12|nr:hypothetical protein [Streptomyces sp. NBC_01431]
MKEFDHAALLELDERLPQWIGDVLAARESGTGIQIDVDGFDDPDLLYYALALAVRAGVPISTAPSQAWLSKRYKTSP